MKAMEAFALPLWWQAKENNLSCDPYTHWGGGGDCRLYLYPQSRCWQNSRIRPRYYTRRNTSKNVSTIYSNLFSSSPKYKGESFFSYFFSPKFFPSNNNMKLWKETWSSAENPQPKETPNNKCFPEIWWNIGTHFRAICICWGIFQVVIHAVMRLKLFRPTYNGISEKNELIIICLVK